MSVNTRIFYGRPIIAVILRLDHEERRTYNIIGYHTNISRYYMCVKFIGTEIHTGGGIKNIIP